MTTPWAISVVPAGRYAGFPSVTNNSCQDFERSAFTKISTPQHCCIFKKNWKKDVHGVAFKLVLKSMVPNNLTKKNKKTQHRNRSLKEMQLLGCVADIRGPWHVQHGMLVTFSSCKQLHMYGAMNSQPLGGQVRSGRCVPCYLYGNALI